MPSIYMIPLLKRIAKDSYLSWGLLLLGLICIADVFRFIYAPIGRAGVVWWGLSFVYILIFVAKSFAHIVHNSQKHKTFLTLIGLCLWIGLIGFYLTNARSLSGETTQEIACVLHHFSASDWGFGQTCLFGYPARQFIIPSIPSLVFGRSLTTLNVGGAFYILMGLILFARGIIETIPNKKIADYIGLLLLAALLHFHFVIHSLFVFEQSIYPISFALGASGIWLLYLKERLPLLLVIFAMLILYTLYSYTPALALAGLGFILLIWVASNKHAQSSHRIFAGILCGIIAIEIFLSHLGRSDLAINLPYPGGIPGFFTDLRSAVNHLLFHTMRTPFMSDIMSPLFFTTILASAMGVFGKGAQIVGLWAIVTFGFSLYAKGYVFYNIDFRLQRFIVVIPVVLASLVYGLRHKLHKVHATWIFIFTLGIVGTGVHYALAYQQARPVNPHALFISWLGAHDIRPNTPLYLLGSATPQNNFQSLPDAMKYFYPTNPTSVNNDAAKVCGDIPAHSLVLYPSQSVCTEYFAQNTSYALTQLGAYYDAQTAITLILAERN